MLRVFLDNNIVFIQGDMEGSIQFVRCQNHSLLVATSECEHDPSSADSERAGVFYCGGGGSRVTFAFDTGPGTRSRTNYFVNNKLQKKLRYHTGRTKNRRLKGFVFGRVSFLTPEKNPAFGGVISYR